MQVHTLRVNEVRPDYTVLHAPVSSTRPLHCRTLVTDPKQSIDAGESAA
jgi:hypothetical protein